MSEPTTQTWKIGDCIESMRELPDESIDTVVTSPPYWGLRDYGVDGQIGLEQTLEEYHNRLLEVTAEIKRVMKPSAVLFFNHGDSYGGSQGRGRGKGNEHEQMVSQKKPAAKCLTMQNERLIVRMIDEQGWILRNRIIWKKSNPMPSSVKDRFSNTYEAVYMLVKSKKYWFDLDAVRAPYTNGSVGRAKRADRLHAKTGATITDSNKHRRFDSPSEVNALQKSHTTECNPLGKNPGDVWAMKSPEDDWKELLEVASEIVGVETAIAIFEAYMACKEIPSDVWTIPTQPYPGSHFAVFPPALVEMAIKAGCPAEICPVCGHIRERIIDREFVPQQDVSEDKGVRGANDQKPMDDSNQWQGFPRGTTICRTVGWTSCECNSVEEDAAGWIAGTVLDPFAGRGTVGEVARNLDRNAILFELNPEYEQLIKTSVMAHTPSLDTYSNTKQSA